MKKSTLIVSLDFELFWGMQDCSTIAEYGSHIIGGRRAIPALLELFRCHDIHATWATVGLMFAEGPGDAGRYFPAPDLRPTYADKSLSCYKCHAAQSGTDSAEQEYYYALPVIRQIAETPGMEIGSHTFSHYYCREPGQTPEQFRADMQAAKSIAAAKGFRLSSVVLPRNQCEPEYTAVLSELGFSAYRDEENDWIHEKVKNRRLLRSLRLMDVYFPLTGQGGYIPKTECGIVNLVGSRMYKPLFRPLVFMEKLKIRRIKKQMLHAAKNGLVFHLWWHPHNIGVNTEFHLAQLEEIFSYYDYLNREYGMESMNMREAAEKYKNT